MSEEEVPPETDDSEEQSMFPDFQSIDDYIHEQTGDLMDVNAEMIQFSRKTIYAMEEFLLRFTEIIHSIKEAHVIGAMMTNNLTGDMIIQEYGVKQVELEEEEGEGDE